MLGKYTGAEHGDGLNARSILSLTTLGATRIPISKNSAHHGVPVCFHGSRRAYTCAKRLARQRSSKQSRLFNKHLPFTAVEKGLRGFATKNAPFQCFREKPIELVRRVSPSYSGATLVCLRRAEFCVFLCDALR